MSKDIDPEMRDLANKNFKKLLVKPPQEPRQDNTKHYRCIVGEPPQETGVDGLVNMFGHHVMVDVRDRGSIKYADIQELKQALLQIFEKEAVEVLIPRTGIDTFKVIKAVPLNVIEQIFGIKEKP